MTLENKFPAPIDIEPSGKDVRSQLIKLANGELSPSQVPPIVISDLRKRKSNPSVTLYLTKGSSLTFDSRIAAAYENAGAIALVPEEDLKLGYKWIDIYGIEKGKEKAAVIGSLKINAESERIESQGWYGPERQTFLDFAAGKLDIGGSGDLPSFRLTALNKNSIYFGRVDGQYVRFTVPPSLISKELEIVPKHDAKLGYLWIDGYSDDEKEGKVLTRRVLHDKEGIKIVDWPGYEMQSIVDWFNGNLPTDQTKRAEIFLDKEKKSFTLELGEGRRIFIRDQSELDKSKPIYFSARESGPYKWIDVGQDDEDESRTITRLLLDYSEGKVKLRGGWQGPQRQAVADFVEGSACSPYLESFMVILDNNRLGHITSSQGKDYRIALRSSAFSEREEVLVTPLLDEEGKLMLEVRSPSDLDTVLARSVFDRESNMFKTTSELLSRSSKPQTYWSPEKIFETAGKLVEVYGDLVGDITNDSSFNQAVRNLPGGWRSLRRRFHIPQLDDEGLYTDESGIVWTHGASIARRVGKSIQSVQLVLKRYETETKQMRAANGRKINAYKLDEAMSRFKIKQRSISTEEADELLRSVFS